MLNCMNKFVTLLCSGMEDRIFLLEDRELVWGEDYISVVDTEDDDPILVKQWMGSTRYGDRVQLVPRSGCSRAFFNEYKAQPELHYGVLQRVFKDVFNKTWFEMLYLIEGEPKIVLYRMDEWTFN